jgi:hypothetical protein
MLSVNIVIYLRRHTGEQTRLIRYAMTILSFHAPAHERSNGLH